MTWRALSKALGGVLACASLACPAAAQADGLQVSVNRTLWFVDPPGPEVTTLLAGAQAKLVATVWVDALRGDCPRRDFGPDSTMTVTVAPPPGVDVTGGQPLTRTVPLLSSLHETVAWGIEVSWPVVVQQAGSFQGSVSATATTVKGRVCSAQRSFTIGALSGQPEFRVLSSVLNRRAGAVAVVTQLDLPGLTPPTPDAYNDTVSLLYQLRLRQSGRRRFESPYAVGGFDARGIACAFIHVGKTVPRALAYESWLPADPETGFSEQHGHGRLQIHRRARTRAERSCVRQASF